MLTYKQKATYEKKSEAAASAERVGNYAEAANLWNSAAKVAYTTTQEKWCSNRCDFCERVAEKPF